MSQGVKTNLFTVRCGFGCSGSLKTERLKGLANGLHREKWGNYGLQLHMFKTFSENKLLFVGTLLCCVTGMRINKLEQWHLRKIMCTLKIFCYNMDHTANSD